MCVCAYACGVTVSVSQIFSFPKCLHQVWTYPASYSIVTKGKLEVYCPGSKLTTHSHIKPRWSVPAWFGMCLFVCVYVSTSNQPLNGINSRKSLLLHLRQNYKMTKVQSKHNYIY